MPLDSLEFCTSLQRLLVALILILVPLTVFGFYVALQADNHTVIEAPGVTPSMKIKSEEYAAIRGRAEIAGTPTQASRRGLC
ncbi:MAG: hypothetical protein WCF26_23070 [Candidatus Sulfotelmatobacter sp.]